jgi:transposase
MKPSRPPESLSQSDWQQTPPTVQAYLLNLHQRLVQLQQQIERLRNRLQRTAKTSDKPPSSDSPFQRHAGNPSKPTGKRGARQGHPGAGPKLHRPTERQAIYPEPCICGQGVPRLTTPYHTHQVMELPSTLMHVTHWVLHQGKCAGCGKWLKARLPKARQSGYGPRLTALTGELSAMHRTSRRGVQDFCRSVLGMSISLGAIQRLIDRTSLAIVPHDAAIARLARKAPVGYVDETPWYCWPCLAVALEHGDGHSGPVPYSSQAFAGGL